MIWGLLKVNLELQFGSVVEYLPSMCEALHSILSIGKIKINKLTAAIWMFLFCFFYGYLQPFFMILRKHLFCDREQLFFPHTYMFNFVFSPTNSSWCPWLDMWASFVYYKNWGAAEELNHRYREYTLHCLTMPAEPAITCHDELQILVSLSLMAPGVSGSAVLEYMWREFPYSESLQSFVVVTISQQSCYHNSTCHLVIGYDQSLERICFLLCLFGVTQKAHDSCNPSLCITQTHFMVPGGLNSTMQVAGSLWCPALTRGVSGSSMVVHVLRFICRLSSD
jgi:hypothetical protein